MMNFEYRSKSLLSLAVEAVLSWTEIVEQGSWVQRRGTAGVIRSPVVSQPLKNGSVLRQNSMTVWKLKQEATQ